MKIFFPHKGRKIATRILILGLFVGLIQLVSPGFFGAKSAHSSSLNNVSGYAWSENIGWISFNDTNDNSPTSYGVNVDVTNRATGGTGDFSGYAWSQNIGWVSFNRVDTGTPPGAPFNGTSGPIAQVNWSTGAVTGWARALSGVGSTGGWDGWIKLAKDPSDTGALYGVRNSGNDFVGFAWGADVAGWIDFAPTVNSVSYGVKVAATSQLTPTTAQIIVPTSDVTVAPNTNVFFSGSGSTDSSRTITNYEWRESDCTAGTLLSSASSFTLSNPVTATRSIYFRVKDSAGTWSTCALRTVTVTNTINAPTVIFTADTTTINPGASATLSWSSTNATSCTASGAWTGTQSTSGTYNTGALNSSQTYTLYCSGNGYDSSPTSVTITVVTPIADPTATINTPASDPTVNINTNVSFSGSGTAGSPRTITNYEWRESNCSTGTLLSTASSFTLSNPTAGTRTIYFRVKDSSGIWSTNCPLRTVYITSNGVCGSANYGSFATAPTTNLCSVGNASPNPPTGSGPWYWICTGAGGGTDASCSAFSTAAVEAFCGAANGTPIAVAPTTNLCNPGNASAVTGTAPGPWAWTCSGLNGDPSVKNCSAPAGTCGNNVCDPWETFVNCPLDCQVQYKQF